MQASQEKGLEDFALHLIIVLVPSLFESCHDLFNA
jgi:hypothetical protein